MQSSEGLLVRESSENRRGRGESKRIAETEQVTLHNVFHPIFSNCNEHCQVGLQNKTNIDTVQQNFIHRY